ncbi:MAG: response regulator [Acidobacteriota bacterium]
MPNRKLLLADDSVTIQKVINLTFADEGIEVSAVSDGDAAMQRFNEFRPDIVLADVNMPGLNGYQICEELRGREDAANIPVILLVGKFEPFDEDEARRVGANDWITKPFQSIRQLVARVTGLLDGAAAEPEPVTETPSVADHYRASAADDLQVIDTAHSNVPENEDIDSLYRQSIAETVELPRSFTRNAGLGDSGMDDDMIEMSYGASLESAESTATPFDFILPQEPISFEPVTTFEPLPHEEPILENFDDRPEPAYEHDSANDTLPAINFTPVDIDQRPEPKYEYIHPAYDTVPSPMPEPEPEAETLQEEVYEPVHESVPEPEPAYEPAPHFAAETAPLSYETRPDIQNISNLLEIPTAVAETREDPRQTDDVIGLDAPAPVQQDLSPEFIEAVARKVIEKISENVIRQIAWQVVPQVADSVLREKTQREPEQ